MKEKEEKKKNDRWGKAVPARKVVVDSNTIKYQILDLVLLQVNDRPEDQWIHKSQTMRCITCMYYVPKSHNIGRCRCHAPSLSGWPAMFPNNWCGDHKLDAEKL